MVDFKRSFNHFQHYVDTMTELWKNDKIASAIWQHPDVISAAEYMEIAHDGVKRKYSGVPYSTHPKRVAMFASLHEQASVVLCKAILSHDILEDCPGYTYQMLVEQIGKAAADIVIEVTNVKYMSLAEKTAKEAEIIRLKEIAAGNQDWETASKHLEELNELHRLPFYANRAEKKQLDRNRLSTISTQAKILKLFDRLDNIFEIPEGSDFSVKYAKETELLMDVIGYADLEICSIIRARCSQLLKNS